MSRVNLSRQLTSTQVAIDHDTFGRRLAGRRD